MRQLLLVVLVLAGAVCAQAEVAEFEVPCDDDGLAHIPDLPEGARRPYSVRKRSRTAHRDAEVSDDTPKLPPGQRRFDAVLPDEQGSDISSSGAPPGGRGQRPLELPTATDPAPPAVTRATREDVNDVLDEEPQPQPRPTRRRRPAYPKKALAEAREREENYPADHPAYNAKQDAVVDSYEAVRRHPTHLPQHQDEDDNLTDNDVAPAAPAGRRTATLVDQVALEDISVEHVEDNVADQQDPDLPPGYRSKFPARTFTSDVGVGGDVLRIKPRKRVNQYHREEPEVAVHPAPSATQRATPHPHASEEQAQPAPTLTLARGRQRHRESHPVHDEVQGRPRPAPLHQEGDVADDTTQAVVAEVTDDAQLQKRPLRRRPRPRPSSTPPPVQDDQDVTERQPLRRRPRPRPAPQLAVNQAEGPETPNDQDNAVSPSPQPEAVDVDLQPRRRPLRRRLRPRPQTQQVVGDLDNTVAPQLGALDEPQTTPAPRRRPRPDQQEVRRRPAAVVNEQSLQQGRQGSRGHGRRLSAGPATGDNLPQVVVEHDGTAAEKKVNEPTLVRSAVKKVPAGSTGGAGNPSPALIQKIVKNTLRRLKPQIAEHEGDVGVDILVKIIQVDE